MAWVRYDDGFHDHAKTAVVRAGCVEALALHLLANTWTSRTQRPGFIPAAIPFTLVGSKAKAKKWTEVLVAAALWLEVDGGWEFVNHARYRSSGQRQTPGTPADLSAKRAAAGSKGGSKTAAKRAASAASADSNGEQASSKPCSPVVASNEATPEPVRTTSAGAAAPAPGLRAVDEPETEGQRVNRLTKGYVDQQPLSNWPAVSGVVRRAVRTGRYDDTEIRAALERLATDGRSVTVDTLRYELDGMPGRRRTGGHVADRMAVGYGDADRTAPARTLTPDEWAQEGRSASGGTR